MSEQIWTPAKAAIKLVNIVEQFSQIHSLARFPIDVEWVALETANIFKWKDPITKVEGAAINNFEGALYPDEERKKWIIIYNNALNSAGRIRFTQAHELGHYILHRTIADGFQCKSDVVLGWPGMENIETQADEFASYLLMPINDFRDQTAADVNLNVLNSCAERYGVSLTAAALKWVKFTDQKAVLILSKSGFMEWAWSSKSAFEAGAYFKTKNVITEIPQNVLAANGSISNDMIGENTPAYHWFKNAEKESVLKEMKLSMDQRDRVLTLLILPKYLDVWPQSETQQ